LLALGADVSLIARDPQRLQRARESLLAAAPTPAPRVLTISADVADRGQAEAAVREAVAGLGPPQWVVASAGIAQPGRFQEVPVEVFERSMAVNYLGTIYIVKAALPSMQGRDGRIVLISSGAGLIGLFGYTPYSPTKFALAGLGEALHAELRHQGIGVTVVYPPDTDTPQLAQENLTKPQETKLMTGAAGIWSADAVADRIVRGAQRGTFAVTPGVQLTALYRLGSVLNPLMQAVWARRITRLSRRHSALAAPRKAS
jgi:3-dehydrosphinganine reductase